jgi:hypothetical protein
MKAVDLAAFAHSPAEFLMRNLSHDDFVLQWAEIEGYAIARRIIGAIHPSPPRSWSLITGVRSWPPRMSGDGVAFQFRLIEKD